MPCGFKIVYGIYKCLAGQYNVTVSGRKVSKGNGGLLTDGGRGRLKDDGEVFLLVNQGGHRYLFAHVGGELDGGVLETTATTGSWTGSPSLRRGSTEHSHLAYS